MGGVWWWNVLLRGFCYAFDTKVIHQEKKTQDPLVEEKSEVPT